MLMLKGKALNVTPSYNPQAEELLSKAVKLDPNLVEAWNQLGEAYWKKGDITAAHTCFSGALGHVSPTPWDMTMKGETRPAEPRDWVEVFGLRDGFWRRLAWLRRRKRRLCWVTDPRSMLLCPHSVKTRFPYRISLWCSGSCG